MSPIKSQRGFTLVELLAVAVLMSLLSLIISGWAAQTFSSYQYLQAQANTSTDLTNTLNRVSRVVRGTSDIVTAQTTTLTIYAYFSPNDAVVDKVRYFVSGTNLNVGVTPPTGTAPNYTYNAADEVVHTLTQNLTLGGTDMFTYYDDTGTALPSGFGVAQVRQIGIYISSNPNPTKLKVPISNQTVVTLRNKKTNL